MTRSCSLRSDRCLTIPSAGHSGRCGAKTEEGHGHEKQSQPQQQQQQQQQKHHKNTTWPWFSQMILYILLIRGARTDRQGGMYRLLHRGVGRPNSPTHRGLVVAVRRSSRAGCSLVNCSVSPWFRRFRHGFVVNKLFNLMATPWFRSVFRLFTAMFGA